MCGCVTLVFWLQINIKGFSRLRSKRRVWKVGAELSARSINPSSHNQPRYKKNNWLYVPCSSKLSPHLSRTLSHQPLANATQSLTLRTWNDKGTNANCQLTGKAFPRESLSLGFANFTRNWCRTQPLPGGAQMVKWNRASWGRCGWHQLPQQIKEQLQCAHLLFPPSFLSSYLAQHPKCSSTETTIRNWCRFYAGVCIYIYIYILRSYLIPAP